MTNDFPLEVKANLDDENKKENNRQITITNINT